MGQNERVTTLTVSVDGRKWEHSSHIRTGDTRERADAVSDSANVTSQPGHPDSGVTRPFQPLVSVVLPTHNRVTLLRDAIASVVAQTYRHWELIVVDDGSTDDTPEVLSAITDHRVRPVRIVHSGNASVARNVGIAAARGSHVAFQDDDDVWLPDKLERQCAALGARPDAAWCYSDAEFVDESFVQSLSTGRNGFRTRVGFSTS